MLGKPLSVYPSGVFGRVDPQHIQSPVATVDVWAGLASHESEIRAHFVYPERPNKPLREVFDLKEQLSSLRERHFSAFTDDEAAKIWYSSIIMLEISDWFGRDERANPQRTTVDAKGRPDKPWLRLLGKISNSMWRWGHYSKCWNDVVDAYEAIRRFDFGLPGFETVLDYTTGCNEIGYATHDRNLFLDGVFGFSIHHKGKPVLTIGFSVTGERRILVQQIQLREKKGNRWLYKLPGGAHYFDYALERLASAFEGWTLCMVDHVSLATQLRNSYTRNPIARDSLQHVLNIYGRVRDRYELGESFRLSCRRFHPLQARTVRTDASWFDDLESNVNRFFADATDAEIDTLLIASDPTLYETYRAIFDGERAPEWDVFHNPLGRTAAHT